MSDYHLLRDHACTYELLQLWFEVEKLELKHAAISHSMDIVKHCFKYLEY